MKVIDKVLRALAGHRFHLEDEKRTQAEIHWVLTTHFTVDRVQKEAPIKGGIIDFIVWDIEPSPPPLRSMRSQHIGIEVKIKGQAAAHLRQLGRYAEDEKINGLVLMTAKPVPLPPAIIGKPVACISMAKAWL